MAGRDHHWTFGDGCHIRFPGGGDPVLDSAHSFISGEGSASISDSGGNLLFHTDGTNLYGPTPTNAQINPTGQQLGGNSSSCHSAIIVPPAGGGTMYHVFAVGDWSTPSHIGQVRYTRVSISPTLALAAPTAPIPLGPLRASEKLAAVPHRDCRRYWVVSLNLDAASPGPGQIFAMLIDSDLGPTPGNIFSQPYPYSAVMGFCTKFSPDGSLLAMSSMTGVDILAFDRATGAFSPHSQVTGGASNDALYGVEFSPNGRYLYFTGHKSGRVWRHVVPASPTSTATPIGSVVQVQPWAAVTPGSSTAEVGALQLGPNGKIYGAKYAKNTLFEIGDPDNPNPLAIQCKAIATQAGGQPLTLNGTSYLGLPTFTRIADNCSDMCAATAASVDEQIAGRELLNPMRPCRGEPEEPRCRPLEMPAIAPQTFIRWGDSRCDCIEGDDTEVMHLTICNPYSNLTLSNLVVHQLVVVDTNGNAVPNLPDGSPSIQLVPVGPYCFDDIAPCTCVSREFVLRLRGAPGGPYRILVRGICFDACFHGDTEACFTFDVCKD